MATVDKEIADEIVALNGRYPGDPLVTKIIEYTDLAGGTSYGLVYEKEDQDKYHESRFVRSPHIYWQHGGTH